MQSLRSRKSLVALGALLVLVILTRSPSAFAVDNHGPKIAAVTLHFYIDPDDPNWIIYRVELDALQNKALPALVQIVVFVSYKYPDSNGFSPVSGFYPQSSPAIASFNNHAEWIFRVPNQGAGHYFIEAYGYDAVTGEFLGFRQRDPYLDGREGLPGIY